MRQTLLAVRLLHIVFIITLFQFIFVLGFVHPPERNLPLAYPLALGTLAVVVTCACLYLRKQFLHAPATMLELQPEDQALLKRWRVGNVLSFCFAENVILYGVLLKFLGESWNVVALFFAAGLVLLLLWTPRAIKPSA
jgi:hypothetical protein